MVFRRSVIFLPESMSTPPFETNGEVVLDGVTRSMCCTLTASACVTVDVVFDVPGSNDNVRTPACGDDAKVELLSKLILSVVPTFDNVNGVPIVIVVIPPVPDWYIDGSNKLRCSVSLEFRFASASTSVIGIFCPDAHVPFVALTDNVPYPKLPTMLVDTSLYLIVADWPLIDSAFVVTRSDF